MTLPNFVVIGAPKAGTGSLHDYLRQHPDIYMPKKKDPRFFCVWEGANRLRFPVQTLAEYEALFADVRGETAIGESTALYFWSPVAPARMQARTRRRARRGTNVVTWLPRRLSTASRTQ